MVSYNRHTSDHTEPGSEITVDEVFIQEALSDYKVEPNYRWWCSIEDLHKVYRAAWNSKLAEYPGDIEPKLLAVRQFGAALNAVFPNTLVVVRRVDGVRKRGRACLVGPVAQEIKRAGRPRKELHV